MKTSVRTAREHVENQHIRDWTYQFKYNPEDPNNFVPIPEGVPI